MPDDLKRGFLRFETDRFQFIANDRAVERAADRLLKEQGFEIDAAFANPGNALNAVTAAAERKAARNDFPNDDQGADDGPTDFFAETFDLL